MCLLFWFRLGITPKKKEYSYLELRYKMPKTMAEPMPPPRMSAHPNDFSCSGDSLHATKTIPITRTMSNPTSNPTRLTI